MSGDTWYFAFGSNLWINQKVERTGAIRQGDERPRIATLKGFRLAFNKRGLRGNVYANIVEAPEDEVLGVVYRWSKKSREKMRDEFEIGYAEQVVEVTTDGRETHRRHVRRCSRQGVRRKPSVGQLPAKDS